MITHTPPIQHALDVAAKEWPTESSAQQIAQLAIRGARDLERHQLRDREAWRQKVLAGAGCATGTYGPNYLAELRAEWPD